MQRHTGLLPVLTAAEMREWEARCFAPGALSERVVMESAGRTAALAIAREFPEGEVVAAVGGGNNGGDAIVALRTLRALGRDVRMVPVGKARAVADLAHGWEIPVHDGVGDPWSGAGVIVDGVLGTGAAGAPREPAASVIRAMNASGSPIVALDGPSGVDLATGAAAGEAVEAAVTVTFGGIKRGLLLHPGRRLAGRILLAEVGFPPLPPAEWSAALVTERWARALLPGIPPDAHKGSVGLVAVVAGRSGVGGAVIMAAMGALRAGCGGVRVFSAEANRVPVHSAVPEAVFFDRDAPDAIEGLAGTRAMLIGPGIGTDERARDLVREYVAGYSGRVVMDADALTLLSRDPALLPPEIAPRCVLTPHPGELARLLGTGTDEVLADRFGAARAAAERYGCAVLAKGAPSCVAAAGQPVLVSVAGHSGVATGGMGDTLGGIVAALLAAGLDPYIGAAVGLHFAGRAATTAGRGRGLLPRDVAEALPHVLDERSAEKPAAVPFLIEIPAAR